MITAVIDAGQHYCQAVSDLWQWDYGQTLRIQGVKIPAAVEVQFSTTDRIGETVTRIGVTKEGVTEVPIPDTLLDGGGTTQDYTIYAFVYIENGDSGKTEYRVSMKVRARPKPEAHATPEEGELFRQAIVAVAESADRAESARKSAETSADEAKTAKENAETAAKVAEAFKTEAETARSEAVRAATGSTDAKDSAEKSAERAETAKEEIQESAVQIQKNATEIDSLKEDKITKPAEAPTIGKIIRVKSVNEDGTFICEWADSGGSNLDVRINGESIVQNGTAEIPLCTKTKEAGLISIDTYSSDGGLHRANNATGLIRIASATNNQIDERRNQFCPIVPETIDYAVKAAMCDGKGAMWTADEQTAARKKMGIYDWEDILDVTLEEDGAVNLDLNGTFKDLYLYINQSNVETPITGATFLTPYCVDDFGYFNSYYPSITTSFKDIAAIWHYNENMAYRYACATNPQKESTGTQAACLKVWDKNNRTDSKIYPSGAFIRLNGLTVWKAKTRIVVKGVRA